MIQRSPLVRHVIIEIFNPNFPRSTHHHLLGSPYPLSHQLIAGRRVIQAIKLITHLPNELIFRMVIIVTESDPFPTTEAGKDAILWYWTLDGSDRANPDAPVFIGKMELKLIHMPCWLVRRSLSAKTSPTPLCLRLQTTDREWYHIQ